MKWLQEDEHLECRDLIVRVVPECSPLFPISNIPNDLKVAEIAVLFQNNQNLFKPTQAREKSTAISYLIVYLFVLCHR